MSNVFSHGGTRAFVRAALSTAFVLFPGVLRAQANASSWLRVVVVDADRAAVAGALVAADSRSLPTVSHRATTSDEGRALLGPFPDGATTLVVRRLGFSDGRQTVSLVSRDTTEVTIMLAASAQALGAIRVTALRGDLIPEQRVDRTRIAAVAPHDASEVLRELPGTDAMRRGALALDPVVRGLRDTQLGVYVDAARTFPGGPAGMDTPLSHVDPAHVQGMEVISGPYALTWGAGNLSAIRVTTDALPGRDAGVMGARLSSGYDSNLRAQEYVARVFGAVGDEGRVRYSLSGASRVGRDYVSGNGQRIAGDFTSREGRGKVGVRTGRRGELLLTAAKQEQRDIDYPGRPLDAAYFDATHLQGEWAWRASRAEAPAWGTMRLRDVELMGYAYDVDHLMDNDDKPTALPNPNRQPPFAVDINTWSGVQVRGGRASMRLDAPAGVELQIGGDVYDADHQANRRTLRRDNGAPVRADLIWGGARIMDAGAYVRAAKSMGRVQATGTVRLDRVHADADSVSPFFASQYGADVSSRETNWSGAATVRVPLTGSWALTTGVGSVVRTAEANERFGDRAAAKRAQTNAEFLGDPRLAPERSTQVDLWLEGRVPHVQLQFNAFARRMDDYITIAPTTLPRAQAGSPPPVFRFINGRASYYGGEVVATSAITSSVTVTGGVSYLYGRDDTLDEPALGVTPVRGDLRARLMPPRAAWFVEAATHVAGAQSRVATTRGERATSGWTTVDLKGGYTWRVGGRELGVRAGARNVLDRSYVQHLTALDAFTAGRIAEPGRVLFGRVSLGL